MQQWEQASVFFIAGERLENEKMARESISIEKGMNMNVIIIQIYSFETYFTVLENW